MHPTGPVPRREQPSAAGSRARAMSCPSRRPPAWSFFHPNIQRNRRPEVASARWRGYQAQHVEQAPPSRGRRGHRTGTDCPGNGDGLCWHVRLPQPVPGCARGLRGYGPQSPRQTGQFALSGSLYPGSRFAEPWVRHPSVSVDGASVCRELGRHPARAQPGTGSSAPQTSAVDLATGLTVGGDDGCERLRLLPCDGCCIRA